MRQRITFLLLTTLFTFLLNIAFGDGGIYDAYVILDTNNSLTYIKADNFEGMIFDNPSQLILKGGQIKTWKNGSTNIWYGHIYYRVYKCNQTPPDFTSIKLNWLSDDGTYDGSTHQTWENKDSTIDLLEGLTPGIYQIEIYFDAYDGDNDVYYYYSNYGNNFKATVVIYNKTQGSGNWSDNSLWTFGVPSGYQPIIINSSDNITLDQDDTASILKVYGTLNGANNTLIFNKTCPLLADSFKISGTFNPDTGKVWFQNYTYVKDTVNFYDVWLSSGIDFGPKSTVLDTLKILTGGYVDNDTVHYGNTGGLVYATNSSYNRGLEWPDSFNIDGIRPNFILITNNTNLNLNTTHTIYGGALTIDSGAALTMDASTKLPLIIYGDVKIDGQYNFSQEVGGDLKLTGNIQLLSNGKINWGGDGASDKGRALFMFGDSIQHITNIDTIPYLLLDSNSHTIFDNDVIINGNGTQFLSIYNNAKLDLNGHTLYSLASGNIEVDATNGSTAKLITGKPGSRLVFTGTSNGTVYSINGGTLTIDTNVTIAVESGTLDFGDNITDLYGTVEIRGSASIANNHYPVYHKGSTLKYVNIEDVTTSAEWPNVNGPSNIWIASTNYKKITLNEDKTITGKLIFQSGKLDLNGYNLTYADYSTLEYRILSDTTYIITDTCAQEWTDANTPFNVEINRGNILIANLRTINNILTIDSAATLKVQADTGQLTVQDTIIVNNGGSLILLCDSNNNPTGSLLANGLIINNGHMIAQRFVHAKHFTYITPPNLTTNSSIFVNNPGGTENTNIYQYNESYDANPDPDNATYSEWTDSSNGFNQAWQPMIDTLLNFPGRGYAYYNDTDRKLDFDGTFLYQDQIYTLSAHYNDANNGYFDGWNLIANPFTCALDWDNAAWDKTAIYDVIYYWDPTDKNYKYYSSSGNYDDGSNTVNGGSRYIPAMQGFFIKVKDGYNNTDFTIPAAARVHSTQTFWTKEPSNTSQFVKLQVQVGNNIDQTVLRFIPEAQASFDDYDAYKFFTSAQNYPQIFSYYAVNQPELAINSLPLTSINDTIPLGIEIKTDSSVNITLSLNKTSIEKHILIIDTLTGETYNILIDSAITLSNIPDGFLKQRFYLTLKDNTSPQVINPQADIQLNLNDNLNLQLDSNTFYDPDPGDRLTYKIFVQNQPDWLNIDSSSLTLSGQATSVGTFEVIFSATDFFGQTAADTFLINVQSVSTDLQQNLKNLAVYPVPASNKLNVTFNGAFDFEILNSAGKIAIKGHNPGNRPIDISKLPAGVYFIRINAGKNAVMRKFIKL